MRFHAALRLLPGELVLDQPLDGLAYRAAADPSCWASAGTLSRAPGASAFQRANFTSA